MYDWKYLNSTFKGLTISALRFSYNLNGLHVLIMPPKCPWQHVTLNANLKKKIFFIVLNNNGVKTTK